MSEITRIAVKSTMDPMQVIMNSLFERKGDVFISNKILNLIKEAHSYTMIPSGNTEVYTFHKRIRGTDALFSFFVIKGIEEIKVLDLDCFAAELGLMQKHKEIFEAKKNGKVYVIYQEE